MNPSLFIETKNRRRLLFLAGGLLGLCAFLLVYGIAPALPWNDWFCTGGYIEKDIQQHYAGWLFYRNSPLSFPLCFTNAINAPEGISVAYTDSIPLFAAFFRLFAGILPATFQYFGLYTLLCFILQGGFGALLLGLFFQKLPACLLGDFIFIFSPVLLDRAFRHTSLGAQFLVLAALYYYFRSRRENRYFYPGLFAVNSIAAALHPYFLPMTYAVTLALLAEYALRTHHWQRPALCLAANMGGTVLAGWVFGLFGSHAQSGGMALYGYFGMNLNALWNPAAIHGTDYSLILPMQNQVNGNYDAFAYLGFGVLIALALGIVWLLAANRKAIWPTIHSHCVLILVCLVLTVFAISNVITANGITLFTLPLPDALIKLFSVFRSGGRLFWPVYYLLLLCAVLVCGKLGTELDAKFSKKCGATVAVLVLVLVQILDLTPALAAQHDAMENAKTTQAYPTQLTSSFWQSATSFRHIVSCDSLQDDALHLALLAAQNNMTTNDPFAARYDSIAYAQQCEDANALLRAGTPTADTLYLFEDEGNFLQIADSVVGTAWCGRIDSPDGLCSWYVVAPGLQGQTFTQATPYTEAYPLRLAEYTDALWNHGVLDDNRQVVCFKDSPFARRKLEDASALAADGKTYPIEKIDDSDPGWLMVTLSIEDATCLWGKELECIAK